MSKGFLWDAENKKLFVNGQEIKRVRKFTIEAEVGVVPTVTIEQIIIGEDIDIRDTLETNFVSVPKNLGVKDA